MRKIFPILALSVLILFQFAFIVLPQMNIAKADSANCNTYCADPAHNPLPSGEICICPTSHKTIEGIIKSITDWIFWLAMVAVPLMIILGGAIITTSGGDPKKKKLGMEFIQWTIVGLVVILFSKGIAAMVKFVFQ